MHSLHGRVLDKSSSELKGVTMEQKQPKQIGILAGKFKPPHLGHFGVIQGIADMNYETHVFVSPVEMDGVTGNMAVDILYEYFKPGKRDRQDVFIHLADGSPVREAFKFVSDLGEREDASDFEVNVYALPEDMNRFKTMDKFAGNLAGVNRYQTERTQEISGTKMREAIRNRDKEAFKKGIPEGIDPEKIWKIVTEEAGGTYAIPADSFETPNQYDFNVQPSQISLNLGGIPNQWNNSQPISRWDFMTNPIVQVREEQSTTKHVKSFTEYLEEQKDK